jgi:hypothetical protein
MKAILKSMAVAVAVVVGLITGLVATAPAALAVPAQATVGINVPAGVGGPVPALSPRPGAGWGQIDILMDEVETERVAKSFWGGAVVCWPAATGVLAGRLGVAGSAAAFSGCVSLATVCAARAYLSQPRKRAAMTMTIWGYGWCWKY